MAFNEDTFSFLRQLAENNNRDWFNEHKDEYEACVREPAFSFIKEVKPQLEKLSPHFMAKASKMGGSLMRVYRDVRFSKNKTRRTQGTSATAIEVKLLPWKKDITT